MKIQKYQLIERCTQDDYSSGTPRPILQQVYFDGETLRATDGYKAVVVHPTDIDENDKPGCISMDSSIGVTGKRGNPILEARKAEKDSDTITFTVDDQGVNTSAGRFNSDHFDASTQYPDFTPNTPKDPGYLFTLDVAHLLDLADALLDMQGKKGGRRHTGEALEFYWSQTHPKLVVVKPMVRGNAAESDDYGVLMHMDNRRHLSLLDDYADVLIERDELRALADKLAELLDRVEWVGEDVDIDAGPWCEWCGAYQTNGHGTTCEQQTILRTYNEWKERDRVAELEAQAKQQRGQWCDPVTTE